MRLFSNLFIQTFIVICSICAASGAIASNSLKLNVLQSYPFGYKNESGRDVGTYWEYLNAMQGELNQSVDISVVPKARVIQYLKQGLSDGAILFRSKKLEPYVEFVAQIREVPIVVATSGGRKLGRYDDLYELTWVGMFRSGSISPKFDQDKRINKYEIPSYPKMVEMLNKGRVQAIVGNGVVIQALVERQCLQDQISITNIDMGMKEQWLVLSKQSKHIHQAAQLKSIVGKLRKDGTLDDIFDNHTQDLAKRCKPF